MNQPSSPASFIARAKARLLAAFYPADPAWREAVLARGRQVFAQALSGLAAPDLEERLTR